MSKNYKGILLVFCLILLAISLSNVGAVEFEDFEAYSDYEVIDTCPCSLVKETLTLHNTGIALSAYTITLEGDAAAWVTPVTRAIIVEPGATKRIERFVNPSCDVTGLYGFTTSIRTNTGKEKLLEQSINVNNCNNIGVKSQGTSFSSCQCTPTEYAFRVSNTGNFPETYHFSIDPYSEYAVFNTDSITLNPDQFAVIEMAVGLPCDMRDSYDLAFVVETEKSKLGSRTPLKLAIRECYDFKYLGKASYDVCELEKTDLNLGLYNLGKDENSYQLELTGPLWLSLDKELVSVDGESQENLGLISEAPYNSRGEFEVKLLATSLVGENKKLAEFNVNPSECFLLDMDIEQRTDDVCCKLESYEVDLENIGTRDLDLEYSVVSDIDAYLTDGPVEAEIGGNYTLKLNVNPGCDELGTYDILLKAASSDEDIDYSIEDYMTINVVSKDICYTPEISNAYVFSNTVLTAYYGEENTLRVEVYNKGIKDNNYEITYEGPAWLELASDSVFVESLETEFIVLSGMAPEEAPGSAVKLSLKPTGDEASYTAMFSLVLKEKTLWDEVMIGLDSVYDTLFRVYLPWTIILIILLILWLIWLLYLLSKLWPKVKQKMAKKNEARRKKKEKIRERKEKERLKKEEKKRKKKEREEARKKKLEEKERLRKEKLEEKERLKQAKIATIAEKEAKKPKKKKERKGSNILYYLLLLLLLLLLIAFATYFYSEPEYVNETIVEEENETGQVIIIPPPTEEETTTTIEVVPTTLEEVTTTTIEETTTTTTTTSTTTTTEPEQSFTYRSWPMNEKLHINLDQYFYDPDFDLLDYSYDVKTEMQNINIIIENGIAELVPRRNWNGREVVVFIADDGKGGVIDSPEITLVVKDEEKGTFWKSLGTYWDYYSHYVLGLILVVLGLIILLIAAGFKSKKKK